MLQQSILHSSPIPASWWSLCNVAVDETTSLRVALPFGMHRAPIPEEEPIPGDEPEPEDDPVPHPDPIVREPDQPGAPMALAGHGKVRISHDKAGE